MSDKRHESINYEYNTYRHLSFDEEMITRAKEMIASGFGMFIIECNIAVNVAMGEGVSLQSDDEALHDEYHARAAEYIKIAKTRKGE